MTSLLDPASREYKLARRHHYKTTKNRAESPDSDWTAFRAAEKKYKARFPPPDLSDLLDLGLLDATRFAEIERTGWKGSADAIQVKVIGLKSDEVRVRKAYTITGMPGG
jgi:alkylated DNA repair protein alkB homolog 1